MYCNSPPHPSSNDNLKDWPRWQKIHIHLYLIIICHSVKPPLCSLWHSLNQQEACAERPPVSATCQSIALDRSSEVCPENSFVMNGKPCYDQAQGYCHNGQCPTYQQHCWRLFGKGTPHSDEYVKLSTQCHFLTSCVWRGFGLAWLFQCHMLKMAPSQSGSLTHD